MTLNGLALGALAFAIFTSPPALAQGIDSGGGAVEITDEAPAPAPSGQPRVGRKAAEKYMAPRRAQTAPATSGSSGSSYFGGGSGASDHFLAVHLGTFFSDTAYKWGGAESDTNVGKWTVGVTYRMDEWANSMDLAIRVDLAGYAIDEGPATKISFLPLLTFPEATSRFPLYFGIGAGLGVFMTQIGKESSLSFDYQLVAGARFFDVLQSMGFFVEAGLKNHLFLLSDGQFNGNFIAVGTVFTF